MMSLRSSRAPSQSSPSPAMMKKCVDADLIVDFPKISREMILEKPKPKRVPMPKKVNFSATSTLHQWVDLEDNDERPSNWYSKREFSKFRKAAKSEAGALRRCSETTFDAECLDGPTCIVAQAVHSRRSSDSFFASQEDDTPSLAQSSLTSSFSRRSSDTVFGAQELYESEMPENVATRRSSDTVFGAPDLDESDRSDVMPTTRRSSDTVFGSQDIADDVISRVVSEPSIIARRSSDFVSGPTNGLDESDRSSASDSKINAHLRRRSDMFNRRDSDDDMCAIGIEHLMCPITLRKIIDYRALHREAVLTEQMRQYEFGMWDPRQLRAVSKAHSKVGRLRALTLAGGDARSKRERRERSRGPTASAA